MKAFCRRIGTLKLWDYIWDLLILLLPFTSVPIIVKLVRSDVVAAPSGVLLPILMLLWALPLMISGKKLSENTPPLVLFTLAALFSTLFSFLNTIPEYKGNSPVRASLSAMITLIIGFCFYLCSALRHDTRENLDRTFRLLSISGAIVCLWTLTQAFFWYKDQRYPEWMKDIQFFVSVGSLYRQRFVGFTLEPSWLAHQLNMLYLPFWFAASLTGYSAFKKRFGIITVERILFLIGMLVLFLTLSRVGLAAFLITVGFCALVMIRRFAAFISRKTGAGSGKFLIPLIVIGILALLGGAAWGILRLLMKYDFRMAGLMDIDLRGRSDPIFYLAEKISLAARFVYWDGGFTIFNAHPILGVGLGHAGFYLPDVLNNYAFRLIEVRDLLYRSNTLLNIKSLWIRVLAECGIVGFVLFTVWYLRGLLSGILRLNEKDPALRTAAWMGCFALLAFLLEGFSLDTFALPYLWFSTGLADGAARLSASDPQ